MFVQINKFWGVCSSIHWMETVACACRLRLSVSRAFSFSLLTGSVNISFLLFLPFKITMIHAIQSHMYLCLNFPYFATFSFFFIPSYFSSKWLMSRSQKEKKRLHQCKTHSWTQMPPPTITITVVLGIPVWSQCITKQGFQLGEQVNFQLVVFQGSLSGKSP